MSKILNRGGISKRGWDQTSCLLRVIEILLLFPHIFLIKLDIYVYNNLICLFICKCQQRATQQRAAKRHLRFSYISILTNLLRTDNEMKSVKTIYN